MSGYGGCVSNAAYTWLIAPPQVIDLNAPSGRHLQASLAELMLLAERQIGGLSTFHKWPQKPIFGSGGNFTAALVAKENS